MNAQTPGLLSYADQPCCLPSPPHCLWTNGAGAAGRASRLGVGYIPGLERYCRPALLAVADPHRPTAVVKTLLPSVSCRGSCGELNSSCGW